MYRYTAIILMFLFTVCYTQPNLFAFDTGAGKNKKPERGEKVLIDSSQSLININNITSWVRQDGFHDWIVGGGGWNGSFPVGEYIGTIYSEGMVWGGIVNDGVTPEVRVNGNTWGTGCYPIIRLYRARPDYQTADLTMDAATYFNIPPSIVTQYEISQIYAQYQIDWNEWPAYDGAPYKDVDNNGYYDATIDTPGVPLASQTIFIKYDDHFSDFLYQSPPIGLEISETYWTFSGIPALYNVIYKKTDIVYTGGSQPVPGSYIDSMYICQWSDPDVGNSSDDFAGCDTALNLGYAYNANPVDIAYEGVGLQPPATGYVFLQGVSEYTGNPNDSAVFNFKWRTGYKYINPDPMNSFVYFAVNGSWIDPQYNYTGTLEFYNAMRGYMPQPPYPASDSFPSGVADYTENGCYLLTGDPVAGTGKLDGVVDTAGDRRIQLVNGPFNINLGDTVELVCALTSAMGADYLSSITELRKNAYSADSAYLSYVTPGYNVGVSPENVIINNYKLYQNYPNPFNPATTIKYAVPKTVNVELKVFDILGRAVKTLVNEIRKPGIYEVQFNAGNLTSGVYFYRLKAGEYIKTGRMLLLK
jgi:hypothetical protein